MPPHAAQQLARLALSKPATATIPRFFSTSTSRLASRAPSLAQIDGLDSNVSDFHNKQKEFRDHLVQTKKQADSQSPSSGPATASGPAKHNSQTATNIDAEGKGSTTKSSSSSSSSSASSGQKPRDEKGVKGALSSIIYGTKEGQEMEAEMERSFSQVVARGKYVHSIVFHTVKPDMVDEYVELVGGWYPKVANAPDNHVHLVGSWRTEVGDCDTFVHIWEYEKYNGYHKSLHKIQQAPEFAEFDRKLKTLITSKKVSLMQEFSFWPTTAPRKLGGVFELRSYTLHPGNLLEWEVQWRKGLKARMEVMEGVGAWFTQIGDLNVVHHMWQFADLEERRKNRVASWEKEGWSDTVHKTVPLIQSMKSAILVPMPWSPVA